MSIRIHTVGAPISPSSIIRSILAAPAALAFHFGGQEFLAGFVEGGAVQDADGFLRATCREARVGAGAGGCVRDLDAVERDVVAPALLAGEACDEVLRRALAAACAFFREPRRPLRAADGGAGARLAGDLDVVAAAAGAGDFLDERAGVANCGWCFVRDGAERGGDCG